LPKYIHPYCQPPLNIGLEWLYNHDAVYGKEVYLCEGVTDTLTALQLGLNACGTLGKLSTLKDPALFKRTGRVYIIPDNDEAGYGGAFKVGGAIFRAQSAGKCGDLKIITLPEGYNDLNEWAKDHNIEDFKKLETQPWLDFWIRHTAKENLTESELGIALDEGFYKPLSLRGSLERTRYFDQIAEPVKKGGLGIKKTFSEKRIQELSKIAREKPRENAGKETIFKNYTPRCCANDVYIDEKDGKPTLLYTTFILFGNPNSDYVQDAKPMPHYLLVKPGERPKFGLLDSLNIPQISKEDIPYPKVVNWDIDGDYSFSEFIRDGRKVNGHELYCEIIDLLSTYMWYPDANEFTVIALYIMGTYLHQVYKVFPFLHFIGPQDVGKSTILDLMEKMCFNGKSIGSPTEAHIVRLPSDCRATCIFDEAGRYAHPKAGTPQFMHLDIFRGGYRVDNTYFRYDYTSKIDKRLPESFDPWGPKIFASRIPLNLNLSDRCIVVHGQPAPVEKLRSIKNASLKKFILAGETRLIRNKLHTWMCQNFHHILDLWQTDLENYLPSDLVGRQSELWSPLLCTAAYIDRKNEPDVEYLKGTIGMELLELQRTKTRKSRERVMGEDFDLKVLNAIADVLSEGLVKSVEEDGIEWYSIKSLCAHVTNRIRDEQGDERIQVSIKRLGSLLQTSELCHEDNTSRRMRFHEDNKTVRGTAYSIIPEAVTAKIAAIQRVAVEKEELEPEQLPF
jgi:hypothetical protein